MFSCICGGNARTPSIGIMEDASKDHIGIVWNGLFWAGLVLVWHEFVRLTSLRICSRGSIA